VRIIDDTTTHFTYDSISQVHLARIACPHPSFALPDLVPLTDAADHAELSRDGAHRQIRKRLLKMRQVSRWRYYEVGECDPWEE
jgi:hypothetical protein